jgi:hypothetical protein
MSLCKINNFCLVRMSGRNVKIRLVKESDEEGEHELCELYRDRMELRSI